MKRVIITENQYKKILCEHKNVITKRVLLDKEWISFGESDEFNKCLTPPSVYKHQSILTNKIFGGVWASSIDADYPWYKYVIDNELSGFGLEHHFRFKLKHNAKIYIINDGKDYLKICKPKSQILAMFAQEMYEKYLKDPKGRDSQGYPYLDLVQSAMREIKEKRYDRNMEMIDFYLLKRFYDGIYVSDNAKYSIPELHDWSVESICIFNDDVIVPLTENEFQKAAINRDIDKRNIEHQINYYDDEELDFGSRDFKRETENFANLNVNSDNSHLFKGTHPAILAQGDDDDYDTLAAKGFNGTMDSGIRAVGGSLAISQELMDLEREYRRCKQMEYASQNNWFSDEEIAENAKKMRQLKRKINALRKKM